ncbi:MAG: DJ-1/PfpI family protein [Geothrix sp.]|uniref:DJ-1/PfpI family protein n=1 Tax=Geothrix sp. TaxID=1962974 RepID=UPI003BAF4BE4
MLPLKPLLVICLAVTEPAAHAQGVAQAAAEVSGAQAHGRRERPAVTPLPAPGKGRIPVAFLLAPGAEVVDFAGPWGVFEYVFPPEAESAPFQLYTVAESAAPLKVSGGMTIVPNYTLAKAPQPKVIVVPAQGRKPSPAVLAWLRKAARKADLTMSVCNGSFVLAKAGLLAGKEATAHHGAYALFAADFPDVKVKRGARFVDAGNVSTSGGLTSGIDLALHVVERYYGREVAEQTATSLEYQGLGWKDPDSNVAFATKAVSTEEHPICPLCEMEVDKKEALHEVYRGRTYYFCSAGCKKRFDATPQRFVDQ